MKNKEILIPIIKGILTYLPGYDILKKNKVSLHSGSQARFCYSFWLRHYVYISQYTNPFSLKYIGELGSGGSLGIGICALLTGAKQYTALEIENNFNLKLNLNLLDEIYDLFIAKTSIPDHDEFPQINLILNDYSYPKNLLVNTNFNRNFYHKIRDDLCLYQYEDRDESYIRYIYDWESKTKNFKNYFDYIFSRAVMEHVEGIEFIYNQLSSFLKLNGFMFHDIEFHSHGLTYHWNDYYKISQTLWKLIHGNRKYFINRFKPSFHYKCLINNELDVINIFCLDNYKSITEVKKISVEADDYIYGASFLSRKI